MKRIHLSKDTACMVRGLLIAALKRQIDSGCKIPWLSRWAVPPMNVEHCKPYRGLNGFLLALHSIDFEAPFYMTFVQIKKFGFRLKYNEKEAKRKDGTVYIKRVYPSPVPVVKAIANYIHNEELITQEQYDTLPEEEREKVLLKFTNKVFHEWNICQTNMDEINREVYDQYVTIANDIDRSSSDVDASSPVLDYITQTEVAWVCPIIFDQLHKCLYMVKEHEIHLVAREAFCKSSSYYGALLHEMCHSVYKRNGKSENHAYEECVVEISSAILMWQMGMEKTIDKEHIGYVQSWIEYLYDDKMLDRIINNVMVIVNIVTKHLNNIQVTINKKQLTA